MVPIDPTTDNEILSGQLPGLITGRSTRGDITQSLTEIWPTNSQLEGLLLDLSLASSSGSGDSKLLQSFLFTFQGFLASLTFASTGGISILPDFLGYGESSRTMNRTTGIRDVPNQQAFTLGYIAAKKHVEEVTNGCTTLQLSSMTVSGKKKDKNKSFFYFSFQICARGFHLNR